MTDRERLRQLLVAVRADLGLADAAKMHRSRELQRFLGYEDQAEAAVLRLRSLIGELPEADRIVMAVEFNVNSEKVALSVRREHYVTRPGSIAKSVPALRRLADEALERLMDRIVEQVQVPQDAIETVDGAPEQAGAKNYVPVIEFGLDQTTPRLKYSSRKPRRAFEVRAPSWWRRDGDPMIYVGALEANDYLEIRRTRQDCILIQLNDAQSVLFSCQVPTRSGAFDIDPGISLHVVQSSWQAENPVVEDAEPGRKLGYLLEHRWWAHITRLD